MPFRGWDLRVISVRRKRYRNFTKCLRERRKRLRRAYSELAIVQMQADFLALGVTMTKTLIAIAMAGALRLSRVRSHG